MSCEPCHLLPCIRESARKKTEPLEEKPVAAHNYMRPHPPSDIPLTPTLSRRPLCPLALTSESPRGRGSPKKGRTTLFPDVENDYPFLIPYTNAASTPGCPCSNTMQTVSYAEAVKPRSKRGMGDRECMSPLDMATKKPLLCGSPEQCLQTTFGASVTDITPGFMERYPILSHNDLHLIVKCTTYTPYTLKSVCIAQMCSG